MNKIFGKLLVCCGIISLTACNDYLETTSESLNEKSEVYESPALTALALNGIYGDLCGDAYTQLMTIHQGAGTDVELIDGIGATATAASERGAMNYNATADGWNKLGTLWEKQYETIQHCNRLIDGIKASKAFGSGNSDLGRYLSEAYTIRAMVYLDMVRVFGDIPMMMNEAAADLSNVNTGKADRDAILDQLIADLEWVVSKTYLPWAGSETTEHVTMGYAKGLLANIYMTRAGYAIREAGGQAEGQPYSVSAKLAQGYVKAAYSDDVYQTLRPSDAVCKELYRKAGVQLEELISSKYITSRLFGTTFNSQSRHDMNPSVVDQWSKVNLLTLDNSYYENMFEIPMGFGNAGELGYTVGIRLNDSKKKKNYILDYGYTNSSGKLKTTGVMLYSYGPCDQRRDLTCAHYEIIDFERTNGYTTIESRLSNKPFGLYIAKWDVRKMSSQWKEANLKATAKFGYGINPIRMRYPQILLWYAECVNEYNGTPNADAINCVKAVHERAYNGSTNAYNGTTPTADINNFYAKFNNMATHDDLANAISEENKLEFCGEGFRKWDLIRWNKLHEAIWNAKVDYFKWKNAGIFQKKVYYKYTDDTEKKIDHASVTWYGTNGTNTTAGTEPDLTWFETEGYRSPKGSVYPGQGDGGKDLNGYSYSATIFGTDYANVDTELPSVCGGLVGTQVVKASDNYNSCTDTGVKVKNRYLMPIYTNVLNSSNGRLYNSYGY